MSNKKLYIGNSELKFNSNLVRGEIVEFWGDEYYKISNYDQMPDFFISVVSDSDLWMFISSNGALSAGRKNPDNALFPYYTDDRIHDSHDITGSKTIFILTLKDKKYLWEPFSKKYQGIYNTERNLYKNSISNQIVFEEINHDLSVTFRYAWTNCDRFGFIKKSQMINDANEDIDIRLLDGIQNILPYGADKKFQMEYSTLLDGYKKNELLAGSTIGLFTLSSIPVDRPEPSEALGCTVVWSAGLKNPNLLLSTQQIGAFKQDLKVQSESDVKGNRGAYFLEYRKDLNSGQMDSWYVVADLNKNQSEVAYLYNQLKESNITVSLVEEEINKSCVHLRTIISKTDGLQSSQDDLNTFRHISNTLFNTMRGGLFLDNYLLDRNDFFSFVSDANKALAEKYRSFINGFGNQFDKSELMAQVEPLNDSSFEKLCYEYLPLSFSRRHGDPSRPWNYFSIELKDQEGKPALNYQGNWRDIFQNWEALAYTYPAFLENMITKFVNASTADGYNPYRLTRNGFDWEVLDPEDSWSYIGYWKDHQIIYLLKLLEMLDAFYPGQLQKLLPKEIYAFANVPYRIKSYDAILEDPHNTVDFDYSLHQEILKKADVIGYDGKFILNNEDGIYHVNLAEKLLLPLLVKISNFIPEAGIWLNTQRPEWNDANNALVGYGTSMVTTYYLRRYVAFLIKCFEDFNASSLTVSEEVNVFFNGINTILDSFKNTLKGSYDNKQRKQIVDQLGQVGSDYRTKIYNKGFSDSKVKIDVNEIVSLLELILEHVDHSIEANRRDDQLFHSYNLIKTTSDEIEIRYLYEMLEGQVAVLSSGFLTINDSVKLLKSLESSQLYRKDQHSYILYPNRNLPRFDEKNIIPSKLYNRSKFLVEMLENNDKVIVSRDDNNQVHFNKKFTNATLLKDALNLLNEKSNQIEDKEIELILDIYESVFDHQSFTGRSGTFFKYEGLGSIYWHMVSKLLLAVQEIYNQAMKEDAEEDILFEIKNIYYDIKEGIGAHKNPKDYGAFPTDPYSHTPQHLGAQQPGMTGQVKEDIISRYGELGLIVKEGKIQFVPSMFKKGWFLKKSRAFYYYNLEDNKQSIMLNENMFAFTYCQVPVIYILSNQNKICLTYNDGSEIELTGNELDHAMSQSIFMRENKISKIQVLVKIN